MFFNFFLNLKFVSLKIMKTNSIIKVMISLFKNHTKIYMLAIIIQIFSIICPTKTISFENYNTFYIRADIKTSNGMVTKSNLIMNPYFENISARKYSKYRIKGHSDKDTKLDLKYAAEHNALFNLLISEGLMSLNSKRTLISGLAHQEIVVSYEGIIQYPYEIIREGYMKSYSGYRVEMEVLFSKIKSPEDKQVQLKKENMDIIRKIISFFK